MKYNQTENWNRIHLFEKITEKDESKKKRTAFVSTWKWFDELRRGSFKREAHTQLKYRWKKWGVVCAKKTQNSFPRREANGRELKLLWPKCVKRQSNTTPIDKKRFEEVTYNIENEQEYKLRF